MKNLKMILKNKKAPLLIWSGVACLFGATIATIPMTIKATHAIDKKKKELKVEKLGFKEAFKTVWTYYIPTTACAAVSIPLIILGNKEYCKKIVSYAAYASAAATSLQELKDKIPSVVGNENAKKINESLAQDKVDKTEIKDKSILVSSDSEQLFFEPMTNQYFHSTIAKMDKIANQLTARLLDDCFGDVPFDDYLSEIGLNGSPRTEIMGWSTRHGMQHAAIEFSYDAAIKDDKPCIVVGYKNLRSEGAEL